MVYKKHYRRHRHDAKSLGLPILDKIAKACIEDIKEEGNGEDFGDRDALYDLVNEEVNRLAIYEDDLYAIMQHYQSADKANLSLALELAIEDIMNYIDENLDVTFTY